MTEQASSSVAVSSDQDEAVSSLETAADDKAGDTDGDLLVREGDIAADYLERLLDIVDFDGDIDMDVEGDRAIVAIVGRGLQGLIGTGGVTLDALQELTRLAVLQQTGERSRLMLDVGGYREKRRAQLEELTKKSIERVHSEGADVALDPMNPFERKIVHDTVADADGVWSESEGEGADRHVIIRRTEG